MRNHFTNMRRGYRNRNFFDCISAATPHSIARSLCVICTQCGVASLTACYPAMMKIRTVFSTGEMRVQDMTWDQLVSSPEYVHLCPDCALAEEEKQAW